MTHRDVGTWHASSPPVRRARLRLGPMLSIPSVPWLISTMAFGIPVSAIGMVVSGDLAGMTIYTDRFCRKVFFPQAPPDKPPSPLQVKQRARFSQAMADWYAQNDQVKADWEQITLRASLIMTGHNLWLHIALTGNLTLLHTLIRQTGVAVADPPLVPWPTP